MAFLHIIAQILAALALTVSVVVVIGGAMVAAVTADRTERAAGIATFSFGVACFIAFAAILASGFMA